MTGLEFEFNWVSANLNSTSVETWLRFNLLCGKFHGLSYCRLMLLVIFQAGLIGLDLK